MNENNKNTNANPQDNNDSNKRRKMIRLVCLTAILVIMLSWFWIPMLFGSNVPDENIKTYNEFIELVQSDSVKSIEFDSSYKYMYFYLNEDETNTRYQTDNPRENGFKSAMLQNDIEVVEVKIKENAFLTTMGNIMLLVVQYGLMMAMFMIIFKKIQGGADEMQIHTSSTSKFSDVAGLDEVKESLKVTVDMLKNREKYEQAGAKIPHGTVLYGPPGTGKTLLAKAIAGEAGVNFIAVSGSDFDNKYVGVGADKVRKLFIQAKKMAPCILFIDEIDAIGRKRTDSDKAYECQTLNQLLSCMDGFSASDGIFVFAATNAIESLDDALLRPGRFDSRFAVPLPETNKDRAAIIRLYLKNKKIDDTVSVDTLAKQTIGCSPAAIEAIINEAAIESVKNNGIINQKNIDEAFYRQLMNGHKKKTNERDNNEIKTVAWHESGHALVGYLQNEEVSKISIVPTTSGAGGVTIFNPKKMGMYTKTELENHIRTLYAGRNAEILLNGASEVTTGASNDIREATRSIKEMVSTYGMSKYGLLNLDEIHLSTAELLEEYQAISKRLEEESMKLLMDNKDKLEKIAIALIANESLDASELIALIKQIDNSEGGPLWQNVQ